MPRQKTDPSTRSTKPARNAKETPVHASASSTTETGAGGRNRYSNPAMQLLTNQVVKYSPPEVRTRQIERAEEFLFSVEPDGNYRYQDICKELTDYKPESYPDLTLSGREAQHDLRCFVEDLSDSVPQPFDDAGEPVLSIEDVSHLYNVSTKTVDRWRDRGLASRRFLDGKRKRIGFLKSSVDRFVDQHREDVMRGQKFTQLSEQEREDIIRRARRLARQGGCPSDITKRLAERMNRSPETIRYTLKSHDQDHPNAAVFPNATGPLTDDQKQDIYRRHRRGVAVERIAKEFCRTKTSIYRIVGEVRAEKLLNTPIDYMDSEEFTTEDAEAVIMADPPERQTKKDTAKAPPGLPPYLATLYTIPLLTKEEEAYYFRKMNYLKYKASRVQKELDAKRPKSKDMDRIEELLEGAQEIKNFLIRSNLRLVVSIAKKHVSASSNFFEMVSDGNMSLIRAIEKFDYSRGFKFSTYASWAIMKNYARSIPAEHRQLDRYRTGNDELFMRSRDDRENEFKREIDNQKQNEVIMGILEQLDSRERDIILYRFGLDQETEPQTLEQVGERFGVTKERIRQLEARAIKKLRKIANDRKLDIPGI